MSSPQPPPHDRDTPDAVTAVVPLGTLLAVCVLIGLATYTYQSEREARERELIHAEASALDAATFTLHSAVIEAAHDARTFSKLPAIQAFLSGETERERDDAAGSALALLNTHPLYDQVRLIDEAGLERLRVQRAGASGEMVPEGALQNKSHRDYFKRSLALGPGEIFLSPPGLNRERGEIERPLKPVSRLVMRLADPDGRPSGALVINLLLEPLRRHFGPEEEGLLIERQLLDSQGRWIFAPHPVDEWGEDLGHDRSFSSAHPRAWDQIRASPSGVHWISGDLLISRSLREADAAPHALPPTSWIAVSRIPAAEFTALLWPLRRNTLGLTVFGALIFLLMGYRYQHARALTLAAQRHTRAALRETQDHVAIIDLFLSHAPAAVAMFDNEMRYLSATARWLTDYRLEEDVLGKSHYEVFPEISAEWREIHRRCLAGETIRCDGEAFPRLDGAVDWISWEVRPWHRGDGSIGGIVMLTQDISSRMEAERTREEFVARVSHELRTPMTSIHGAARLISGGAAGPLPEKAGPLFDIVLRNSDRMLALIGDLLDFQKIKLGQLDFSFGLNELGALVSEAAQANRLTVEAAGARLLVQIPAEEIPLTCDEVRLGQVLTNLLSNAAKFSPAGGEVSLTLSREGDEAVLRVSDQGPGVPEGFADQLFEAFTQADTSDTREHGGSGLGLAIAAKIAEAHSGSLRYEPAPGGGACFVLTLPSGEGTPAPRSARVEDARYVTVAS